MRRSILISGVTFLLSHATYASETAEMQIIDCKTAFSDLKTPVYICNDYSTCTGEKCCSAKLMACENSTMGDDACKNDVSLTITNTGCPFPINGYEAKGKAGYYTDDGSVYHNGYTGVCTITLYNHMDSKDLGQYYNIITAKLYRDGTRIYESNYDTFTYKKHRTFRGCVGDKISIKAQNGWYFTENLCQDEEDPSSTQIKITNGVTSGGQEVRATLKDGTEGDKTPHCRLDIHDK